MTRPPWGVCLTVAGSGGPWSSNQCQRLAKKPPISFPNMVMLEKTAESSSGVVGRLLQEVTNRADELDGAKERSSLAERPRSVYMSPNDM